MENRSERSQQSRPEAPPSRSSCREFLVGADAFCCNMASALLSSTVQRLQASAGEQGEGSTILQHISTLEVGAGGGAKAGVGPEVELGGALGTGRNWLGAGSKLFLWLAVS